MVILQHSTTTSAVELQAIALCWIKHPHADWQVYVLQMSWHKKPVINPHLIQVMENCFNGRKLFQWKLFTQSSVGNQTVTSGKMLYLSLSYFGTNESHFIFIVLGCRTHLRLWWIKSKENPNKRICITQYHVLSKRILEFCHFCLRFLELKVITWCSAISYICQRNYFVLIDGGHLGFLHFGRKGTNLW